MNQWLRLPAGVHLTAPVVIAGALTIIAAGAFVREGIPALTSIFEPSQRSSNDDPLDPYLKESEKLLATSQKRFEGRYVFFAPPAPKPPPPPPPPPKPVGEAPKPPAIQPAPANYEGTKPTGILGDIVFFGTDKRVRVGEKASDIEVLEIQPPFKIKLGWTKAGHERGEYVVSMWGETTKGFGGPNPFPKTAISGFKEVGDLKAGDTPSGEGKPGDRRGGESAAGDMKAGAKGSDPKLADPKLGDPKLGDPKPGDPKPGDAKRDASKDGPASPPSDPTQTKPATQPAAPIPPTDPPKAASGGEPDSTTPQKNIEYIPLDKLPPFRSVGDITNMSKQGAQDALQKINDVLSLPNVDDHNRARLENDAKLIAERLRKDK